MAAKRRKNQGSLTIGVDLGGTNVRAGLVSRDKLLKVDTRPIRAQGSKDDVLEDLFATIDAVWDDRVAGLGVGVPSLVDPKTGIIHDTTNIPSWTRVPLKRILEKRYGKPVRLNNDANCFALGEKHFGFGRNAENFVGMIIGTGVGAGIITRGKLHSGVFCGAGEFGLIPYGDSILEHYAGGQFFKRAGRDGAEVFVAAEAGDREALKLYDEYGRHLANAVKIILYALAPEMIVFGGSVRHSLKYFEPSLREALSDFAYPSLEKQVKFRSSKVKHVAVLGAARLLKDDDVL